MKSTNRQHGYYHVRVDSGWSVAFWSGKLWYRIGYRTSLTDNQFDEIIEKRIEQPTIYGETK